MGVIPNASKRRRDIYRHIRHSSTSTKKLLMESNQSPIDEQLTDLNVKYEALEEKYNVVVLENTAYKHHIVEIVKENEDLNEEITCNPRINDEDSLLPRFFDVIASNAT